LTADGIDTSQINPETYYFLYNPTYEEMLMTLTSSELNSA